jgi:hypothetical protein
MQTGSTGRKIGIEIRLGLIELKFFCGMAETQELSQARGAPPMGRRTALNPILEGTSTG